MSIMGQALSKAGYIDPRAKLEKIGREICSATTDYGLQHKALFERTIGEADLLWVLFEPFKDKAAQFFLSKINQEIRVERQKEVVAKARKETPGVHTHNGNQTPIDTRRTDGAVQVGAENQRKNDRPNPSGGGQIGTGNRSTAAPARPTAARDPKNRFLGAETVRASLLDSVLVNGRKMGDVPVWEARKWAEKFGIEARFVQLLAANLPPNATIREYRSEDDVKSIWESVQKEVAEGKYA